MADALAPMPSSMEGEKFDSISVFYLLHCLVGPASAKNRVFENLSPHLTGDGVLFGATILGKEHTTKINWFAWALLYFYNFLGVFDNREDEPATFKEGLKKDQ